MQWEKPVDGSVTGEGKTLLLAEDDDQVRALTVRVLERAGYKVLVTCDGEDAVEMLRARGQEISLAVLDVVMPRMDGTTVYQYIRDQGLPIPVVFCTGYSARALDGIDLTTDAVTVIPKPFQPTVLVRTIRKMIARAEGDGVEA